jgi:hypothetical protein
MTGLFVPDGSYIVITHFHAKVNYYSLQFRGMLDTTFHNFVLFTLKKLHDCFRPHSVCKS